MPDKSHVCIARAIVTRCLHTVHETSQTVRTRLCEEGGNDPRNILRLLPISLARGVIAQPGNSRDITRREVPLSHRSATEVLGLSHVLTHAAFDCRADTGDKSRHILRMIDVALPHRSFDSPAIVLKSQERYRIPLRPVLVVLKANALVKLLFHGLVGFHSLLRLIQLSQVEGTRIAINPWTLQELRVHGDIVLGFLLQSGETIPIRAVPCPALNAVCITD